MLVTPWTIAISPAVGPPKLFLVRFALYIAPLVSYIA